MGAWHLFYFSLFLFLCRLQRSNWEPQLTEMRCRIQMSKAGIKRKGQEETARRIRRMRVCECLSFVDKELKQKEQEKSLYRGTNVYSSRVNRKTFYCKSYSC